MALRYAPRRIYLASTWRSDQLFALLDALRADGHTIGDPIDVGAPFDEAAVREANAVLVVPPPGADAYFAIGAAIALRKLLLVLHPQQFARESASILRYAQAVAGTADELVDLLRRYDPVRMDFDPVSPRVVRYRHRETGEVRVARGGAIGGLFELTSDTGARAVVFDGQTGPWIRIEDGGAA